MGLDMDIYRCVKHMKPKFLCGSDHHFEHIIYWRKEYLKHLIIEYVVHNGNYNYFPYNGTWKLNRVHLCKIKNIITNKKYPDPDDWQEETDSLLTVVNEALKHPEFDYWYEWCN